MPQPTFGVRDGRMEAEPRCRVQLASLPSRRAAGFFGSDLVVVECAKDGTPPSLPQNRLSLSRQESMVGSMMLQG